MEGKDREALRYIRTVVMTGSAASFTARNPVLLRGQIGFESDTRKMKVGNGTTAWSGLSYTAGGGGGASALDDLSDVTLTTPSNGQVLKYNGTAWVNGTDNTGGATWGSITGTLSSQTDLQSALNGKQAAGSYAAASHGHAIADVTGLQIALDARMSHAQVMARAQFAGCF